VLWSIDCYFDGLDKLNVGLVTSTAVLHIESPNEEQHELIVFNWLSGLSDILVNWPRFGSQDGMAQLQDIIINKFCSWQLLGGTVANSSSIPKVNIENKMAKLFSIKKQSQEGGCTEFQAYSGLCTSKAS
jgi:hypothetical protein